MFVAEETRPCALVLMGVSGSGKSTIAEALSARLGWRCEDGDKFHPASNIAKMSAGQPLTDEDRWPWLKAIADEIDRLCGKGQRAVFACSALKRAYRDYLVQEAGEPILFVYLEGDAAVIGARIASRKHEYMPASLLASQFATLEVPGADENVLSLPVTLPVEAIAERVVKAAPNLKSFARKQ
jgi:gluconokinase